MRTLLKNCTLITMDGKRPTATACIIEDEKIAWVGDEKEAIPHADEVLDLQGAYVFPGFIDTHAHIFYEGYMKLHELTLGETRSKEEVLEHVYERAKKAPSGSWIVGNGWDEHYWKEQKLPSRFELDEVSPHNPVLLRRADYHGAWVNSLALKIASIDKNTKDPAGGKIYRDSHGNPTGILLDNAKMMLLPYLPKIEDKDSRELIKKVLQNALKLGITCIHDAAMKREHIEACIDLARKNELPVRVYAMVDIRSNQAVTYLERGPQQYGPLFEVRTIKFFMDGAMGSRGASLFLPYHDAPEEHGLILWNENELHLLLEKMHVQGFQPACHAIGDKATHLVLNAYEKVKGHRPRIEHAQQVDSGDIRRFSDLGVIAAMQPLHMAQDMHWVEKRLGQNRAKDGAYIWRSLLDGGATIAGGSDAPVVDLNPLLGIYAAITRQDLQGNPPGGWNSEQCLTPYEALRMYTLDAAYSCFREHELGSIKAGKLADLVVLPENLLTSEPKALLTMRVLYTIVNGRVFKVT